MNAVMQPDLTIANFEAGDIDAEHFGHQGHVYVAWLYIRQYGTVDAITRFDAASRSTGEVSRHDDLVLRFAHRGTL